MYRRRSMFLLAAGIAIVLTAATHGWAQNTPPKLSEEEIQKISKALPAKATAKPAKPHKVLLFWLCEGFFHGDGIAAGNKAIELMGEKTGAYTTVTSDDMSMFAPDKLKEFDAVILNNTTTLEFKNPVYREALLNFVKGGKGIVGTHSSVDNFYKWPEGAAVMGALFDGHPWQEAPVKLDDPQHPLLKAFQGKGFWVTDEMYKMKEPYSRETLRVLLSFDMSKLPADAPTRADKDNAIAWIQQVGKGREFYCSLGHNRHIFWDPAILQFYLDGIQYALGDLPADATPSAKLSPAPEPVLAPSK
ncbi:MAG: ThuA domain-containing protein [Pirellulaceae bacterium]